jgi:hypothetical protein
LSVRCESDGTVVLEGNCLVEDAERLLQLLQVSPAPACDWSRATHIHTSVLQVVLAARPTLVGGCGDPWIQRWIM